MYTSDNTQAKTYIDYFSITTRSGFAINYSLYGFKVTKANEVTAHTWDYANAPKDSWYSSASDVQRFRTEFHMLLLLNECRSGKKLSEEHDFRANLQKF